MESPFCPAEAIKTDADFRLIETFLYRRDLGARNLDHHLDRMARSAEALQIPFDRSAAQARVQQLGGEGPLRCRLTLSARGESELSSAPLPSAADCWNVSLAKQRVRSDDPWLRHKTTRRALYDQARADLPAGVDELLFLNERGEVCEGTITNIFVTLHGGERVTPPIASGLLPGVLRQRLLDRGQVREQVVTLADLKQAQSIFVGNSLRGEIMARLTEN
jgi:4-amino-4-deoxychorismate lyase